MHSVLRVLLRVTLVAYLGVVLVITLWPKPQQTAVAGWRGVVLGFLNDHAVPITFGQLEALANVAMFGPFGVLVGALLAEARPQLDARRLIAPTTGAGALFSTLVELTQRLVPDRVSTLQDVLMNTLGALLGVLLLVAARALPVVRHRRGGGAEQVQRVG